MCRYDQCQELQTKNGAQAFDHFLTLGSGAVTYSPVLSGDKWDKHPFRVYLTGFLRGWDRIDVIAHGEMIQTGKVEYDPAWPCVPRRTWELSSVSAWVLGDRQTPKDLRNNYFAIVGFSHFYYLTARTIGNTIYLVYIWFNKYQVPPLYQALLLDLQSWVKNVLTAHEGF